MAKKTKNSSGKSAISLNKVSFYLIAATAILYLVAMILSLCNVNPLIANTLREIATACIIVVAAILAWRYVAKKPAVWKVLYIVCLLVVVIGIVIPLVL